MFEIWPPRKIRATIATIAMSARISAYSARPWPSSSCDMREMSALTNDMKVVPPFLGSSRLGRGEPETYRRSIKVSTRHNPQPVLDRTEAPNRHPNPTRKPEKAAGSAGGLRGVELLSLDRGAHVVKDVRDLAAQEDQGDDRDDGDEREDQRVLRETLALLVLVEPGDE